MSNRVNPRPEPETAAGREIRKVLVANRGEIARRVFRTVRALGMESVAVYVHEDRTAPHVREADQAIELSGRDPIAAYLDGGQIVDICRDLGVDAIHPGYGFLAENAEFAKRATDAGLVFVGPDPEVIELMGDKVRSREFAAANGCPVAPSVVQTGSLDAFLEEAEATVGFPLLIKASAGGGGKGMTIVRDATEFADKARTASSEAERYFGDGRIYAERYLERPRHIEVQVLGDGKGNAIHLHERECSIQRRFQKVLEEAPAPNLPESVRSRVTEAAVSIACAAKYRNAGTVEFIVDASNEVFFLEMNTRLQVEHPVTEMITGIDLVAEQLAIAASGDLRLAQSDIRVSGHAIECRIAAEEPDHDFRPAIGRVLALIEPAGEGVRLDNGITEGQTVSPSFDPTFAKLIAHGGDRAQAIARIARALNDLVVLGLPTNIAFLERVVAHDGFRQGDTTTAFIPENADSLRAPDVDGSVIDAALAIAALSRHDFAQMALETPEPYASMGLWRN